MNQRIANWWRTVRFNLASMIMDKRDHEAIVEIGEINRLIVERLGWEFINDLRRGAVVTIEEEFIRLH